MICGARFFLNGDDSPGNACHLARGHKGRHETGVSSEFMLDGVSTRMSISFGEKEALDLRSSVPGVA